MGEPEHISRVLLPVMQNIINTCNRFRREHGLPLLSEDRKTRSNKFLLGINKMQTEQKKHKSISETGREECKKTQNELIHQILLPRIMDAAKSVANDMDYLQWLAQIIAGGLRFEIGEQPYITKPCCFFCGRPERPTPLVVRVAEYDIKYNFVCQLCTKSFAPELLPELERQNDEVYKEIYGPDYKKEIKVSQVGDGEQPF